MKTEPIDRELSFGQRRIRYSLHLSPRKRLRLVVTPSLDVLAYAPATAAAPDIAAAVQSRAPWIARQLDSLESFHPLPTPHKYISGETFVCLGRQYRLRVDSGPSAPAKLHGRFLHVQVPDRKDTRRIKHALEHWQRTRARENFERLLAKWEGVAVRHGISTPSLVIRRMRTRWGSCTSAGRITLNVDLIQAPVHCIEYVIVHELCHLKHHNHSKSFYRLLTLIMPDWPARKRLLDSISLQPQLSPRAQEDSRPKLGSINCSIDEERGYI